MNRVNSAQILAACCRVLGKMPHQRYRNRAAGGANGAAPPVTTAHTVKVAVYLQPNLPKYCFCCVCLDVLISLAFKGPCSITEICSHLYVFQDPSLYLQALWAGRRGCWVEMNMTGAFML